MSRRPMALSKRRPTPAGRSKLLRAAVRLQNQQVARSANLLRARTRRRNTVTAGFLGIEVKYKDFGYGNTTIAAQVAPGASNLVDPSGTISLMCINQGDGPSDRDGKKIRVRSIYIKGTVFRASAYGVGTPGNGLTAYVACVLDTQANGASVAPGQVFQNPNSTAAGATTWLRNLEFSSRYRILRDQAFNMNASLAMTAGPSFALHGEARHFEWYIPCNFDVTYNTTTPTATTVASIVTNNVGMIAACAVNSATDSCSLLYNARVRYVG